jgi:GcrA cell cycle regulator
MTLSAWTEERIADLKKHYADGLSASEIANRLGWTTRNAVIAKIHRLGLPLRGYRPGGSVAKSRGGVRIPGHAYISGNKPKRRHRAKPQPSGPKLSPAAEIIKSIRLDGLPLPPPQETDIARVALQDAEEKACRWPCAEPDAASRYEPIFCGIDKVPGTSYCAAHLVRAHAVSKQPFVHPSTGRRSQERLKALEEFEVA